MGNDNRCIEKLDDIRDFNKGEHVLFRRSHADPDWYVGTVTGGSKYKTDEKKFPTKFLEIMPLGDRLPTTLAIVTNGGCGIAYKVTKDFFNDEMLSCSLRRIPKKDAIEIALQYDTIRESIPGYMIRKEQCH